MVFATDFDPINSHSTAARHKGTQVHISPVHQTDRLIAQATQAQKVAQKNLRHGSSTSGRQSFSPVKPEEVADVEIASRVVSLEASDDVSTTPSVSPLRKPKLPFALKVLNQVQHGSTVVTGILVAGALVLYGSSVYVDRSVNRTVSHLNHLQSDSQQLTSANEAIKQSLAEQAMEEDSGLEPYEAGDVLFVSPEPLREQKEVAETEKADRFKPLGY